MSNDKVFASDVHPRYVMKYPSKKQDIGMLRHGKVKAQAALAALPRETLLTNHHSLAIASVRWQLLFYPKVCSREKLFSYHDRTFDLDKSS